MNDQPYSERLFALTEPAICLLKTLLYLERPYSASYLGRICQGNTRYELRKITHQELETFGSLEMHTYQQITDMIYHLIDLGHIQIKDSVYGTLEITQAGEAFLQAPESLELPRKDLFAGWSYYQLMQEVRAIRTATAEAAGKAPYEIFNNHSMTLLLRQMPVDEKALREIPGMEELARATQLELLMAVTQMVHKIEENERRGGLYTRVYSPSHRKVKELFEGAFSVADIAERQGITAERVLECLYNLHQAGEIDLLPHIGKVVDAQSLHKGVEYFRQVSDQRLKPAHEVLGLDYSILKICRLQADPEAVREESGTYN